jgi:hypothetical protein
MAIGQKYSYATIAPIQGNPLGDAMQDIEDNAFKYRAEKRLEDEAKKKAQEEKIAEVQAYREKFPVALTGVRNIDNTTTQYAMDAREKGAKLLQEAQMEKDPYKRAEKLTKANSIKQSFDILKQVPEILNKKKQEYAEGIKQGKYNPRSEQELIEKLDALEKNSFMYVGDDGQMRLTIFKTDENGNPTDFVEKDTTVPEFLNGLTPKTAFNYETYKDSALKNVKPYTEKIQSGATIVEQKKVSDENRQQAKTYADVIISDPNKLYEAQFIFNEKDPEKLRAKIENDFVTSIEKSYSSTLDTSVMTEARAARKERKEEEATTPIIGTGTITSKEGYVEGTKAFVPKGTKNFAIANAERKLGTGKIEKLKEVRVKPDGNLVFVVQETYEGENVQTKRLSEAGKKKEEFNKKNAKAIKEGKVKEQTIYSDDYDTVTTASKRPTTKAYDTGAGNADDAENFAVMLKNPDTGEYFSGLNEARRFFRERARGIVPEGKKETPEERAKRIASGK